MMEQKLGLDSQHVIVDKELWMNADCGCRVFRNEKKGFYVKNNPKCKFHKRIATDEKGWETWTCPKCNKVIEFKPIIGNQKPSCKNCYEIPNGEKEVCNGSDDWFSKLKKEIPNWIDNPNGEINPYTQGRKDERIELREKLFNLLNKKDE